MCTSERKERKEIEQDFSQPWEQSDLVLLVEGQRLHVHRLILSMSSPVFKKMFDEDFKEKTEQEIPLPDEKFLEVREMLLVIYPTTQKSVNERNCYFLLTLAHEYQISTVIEKCQRCLREALNKQGSDILDMLFVAQKYSLENVLDECIKKTEKLSFEEMTQHPKYKQIEPLSQRKMIELQWRNVVQENHRLKELANEAVGKWESIVFMVGNHIISGTDKQRGILSARARLGVFFWVYPLVCTGAAYHVPLSKESCVICGKKSQMGSFRSVITSDDVKNCFAVKISTSYRSAADVSERCMQKSSSHI